MSAIAYVTDSKMLELHRLNNHETMNFWRLSNNVNFSDFGKGDLVFFLSKDKEHKKRSEKGIVGFGRVTDISVASVKTMWERHGIYNGYNSLNEFKEAILRVSKDRKLPSKISSFLLEDVKDAEGNVLVTTDHIVTEADAAKIIDAGITSVKIRSVLGCRSRVGICAKCYGANLARGDLITIGEPVGIIAAQSIGEPGTQFTMRNFHTGGVAGPDTKDITQGLPRVEELFEARRPKRTAYLAEIDGVISREPGKKGSLEQITISNSESGDVKQYQIPASAGIRVEEGQTVKKGDRLTDGVQSPQDVLRILGVDAVHSYLISAVQRVYRANAVDINDKHIEVVLRQMMRKVRIEDSGSTELLAGSMVDIFDVEDRNGEIAKRTEAGEEGLIAATVSPVLLGITKASLATDSFMSAASFQETTRVLTEAAIKGKADKLVGLKENVIIGKLIPAGTGIDRYHVEERVCEDNEPESDEMLSELPADETEVAAEEITEE